MCFTPFYKVLSRQKHSRGWVEGSGHEALVLQARELSSILRTRVKMVGRAEHTCDARAGQAETISFNWGTPGQ